MVSHALARASPHPRAHEPPSASASRPLLPLLAALVAAVLPLSQAQGWGGGGGWSLGAALNGFTAVASLCATSNCQRSQPLPQRPGGRYADFGPYKTRLVYMSSAQTRRYGFSGAVVACPVMERSREKVLPNGGRDAPGRGSHTVVTVCA